MRETISFLTASLVFFSFQSQAQQLTIGTYNLRYDNKGDSSNLWVNRAPVVASLIRFHGFDVFGTQEGLLNQLEDLSAALPEYTRYGIGRDDGKDKGEHSAIFFKKDKFRLLGKGDFWLSETPDKPGPGWDAHLNRICSWVQLQELKSKKKFYFFNVHYDHQGVKARQESSKLILQKIQAIAGKAPVVFTGDLNGGHESEWYKTLAGSAFIKDVYRLAPHPYANGGSFNGFGANVGRSEIIDHIFVSGAFTVQRYGILTDTYKGKYPSDHFPVLADVVLK
ncbi:MAG: endonuclease/exonuclease/phosphatase family protein [Williamsia sp.]|nr:endonuclease/exonuclease/phosphatase family protein [Williamsia sp.]